MWDVVRVAQKVSKATNESGMVVSGSPVVATPVQLVQTTVDARTSPIVVA